MNNTILVINPGSTSTKLSIFEGRSEIVTETREHTAAQLKDFNAVIEQEPMRLKVLKNFLKKHNVKNLAAIAARGGLVKPLSSGVYEVNQAMTRDLKAARYKEHASNMGAILAADLAEEYDCKAFIADPVVVDEMEEAARYSGIKNLPRKSIFHALNQKSAARKAAEELGISYERGNFIVAHMGGGISVGAHRLGRVIDVNNALDGDGPFSPERSGGVPAGDLVNLCFSGSSSQAELKKKIVGRGGLVDYLGTNNLKEILQKREQGDKGASLAVQAMVLQISKEIASHGATLKGDIDAVVLTGGIAQSETVTNLIKDHIYYLARVIIIPGEREMTALAENISRVLEGEQQAKEY